MSQWMTNDIPDLTGKRVLVTGANSGLGLETVRALADKGAQVILVCRSLEKGQRALAEIQAGTPKGAVELASLDLASLAAVRTFAEHVLRNFTRLDLLFNNAGIMAIPRRETLDGFETQFGVNHLGHFALTGLLLPLLLTTPASRVITTTSQARSMGAISFDDLQHKHSYGRWKAYGQSKRANLLFAFELQTRLVAAGATTISVAAHPGYAQTGLQTTSASQSHARLESGAYAILGPLMAQSARMGALPQLYAGTSPDITGGELVGPGGFGGMRGYPKVDQRAQKEYDRTVAARLWDESVKLTGVQYSDLYAPSPRREGHLS